MTIRAEEVATMQPPIGHFVNNFTVFLPNTNLCIFIFTIFRVSSPAEKGWHLRRRLASLTPPENNNTLQNIMRSLGLDLKRQ
jgi:hypothetical protein